MDTEVLLDDLLLTHDVRFLHTITGILLTLTTEMAFRRWIFVSSWLGSSMAQPTLQQST